MAIDNIETESLCRQHQYPSWDFNASKTKTKTKTKYKEPLSECVSRRCPTHDLGLICEPLIALVSATVTTVYTLRHEQRRVRNLSIQIQITANAQLQMVTSTKYLGYTSIPGGLGFIMDPSPFSLLVSCLLLGYSASSFAHRRQGRDRCQSLIILLAILTATITGVGLGTNVNLIMLGFIPWALIFAMIFSVFIHWTARRHNRDRSSSRVIVLV